MSKGYYLRLLTKLRIYKSRDLKPLLPHWHHNFLDSKPNFIGNSKHTYRIFQQTYKGIWIILWDAPNPEDIKMAQDDFDNKYPACEDCGKNLFVCTCMLELEGFAV